MLLNLNAIGCKDVKPTEEVKIRTCASLTQVMAQASDLHTQDILFCYEELWLSFTESPH